MGLQYPHCVHCAKYFIKHKLMISMQTIILTFCRSNYEWVTMDMDMDTDTDIGQSYDVRCVYTHSSCEYSILVSISVTSYTLALLYMENTSLSLLFKVVCFWLINVLRHFGFFTYLSVSLEMSSVHSGTAVVTSPLWSFTWTSIQRRREQKKWIHFNVDYQIYIFYRSESGYTINKLWFSTVE